MSKQTLFPDEVAERDKPPNKVRDERQRLPGSCSRRAVQRRGSPTGLLVIVWITTEDK